MTSQIRGNVITRSFFFSASGYKSGQHEAIILINEHFKTHCFFSNLEWRDHPLIGQVCKNITFMTNYMTTQLTYYIITTSLWHLSYLLSFAGHNKCPENTFVLLYWNLIIITIKKRISRPADAAKKSKSNELYRGLMPLQEDGKMWDLASECQRNFLKRETKARK